MMFKGQKTPDKDILEVIDDIMKYMNYLGLISLGMAGGEYEIKFLPLSKSFDEHPYWIITKLVYIKGKINHGMKEANNKKSK